LRAAIVLFILSWTVALTQVLSISTGACPSCTQVTIATKCSHCEPVPFKRTSSCGEHIKAYEYWTQARQDAINCFYL
jgi:hypothetical protein